MKQWIFKHRNDYLNKTVLLMGIITAVVMIPIFIMMCMDGDTAEGLAIVSMPVLIFALIWLLGAASSKSVAKRLIKAMEDAGINCDVDLVESEIEWIDTFGFYGDWVLNSKRGYAFHKDFITDCYKAMVGGYRSRHYGVQIVGKDGRRYDCLGKIKLYDEVVDRIKRLYLGENYETVIAEEAIKAEEAKNATVGNAKMIGLFAGVAIMILGLILIVSAVNDNDVTATGEKFSTDERYAVADDINYNSSYDNVEKYTEYLMETTVDKNPSMFFDVYYDDVDGTKYLAVENHSDYFVYGVLNVYANDAADDSDPVDSITLWMRGKSVIAGEYDLGIGDTTDFKYTIDDIHYYKYSKDYPAYTFEMEEDYGIDGSWTDIAFESSELSEDAIKEVIKYAYGCQVVEMSDQAIYYIYNKDTATKYEDGHYDPNSAVYGAVVDITTKQISMYSFNTETGEDELIYSETVED